MYDHSISLKVFPPVVLLVLFVVEGFHSTSSADSQIFMSENCTNCLISNVAKRHIENNLNNNTSLNEDQKHNQFKKTSDDDDDEFGTVFIIGTLIFSILLNISAFVVLMICCQKKKKQSKEEKKKHELITQMFNTIIFEKKVKTEFWVLSEVRNVLNLLRCVFCVSSCLLDFNEERVEKLSFDDIAGYFNDKYRFSLHVKSKSSLKSKADIMEYEIPLDLYWEFPRENVTLDKFLGEGAFGKVMSGEAKGILEKNLTTTVAVKMLKDKHSDDDMINLVSEMEIMKMIGEHKNIINLLGCCTQDGPLLVIMEFALYGNLRDFLRDHRPLSHREISIESNTRTTFSLIQLVSFALQVCKGMQYLTSRKCIHRDLAARNVLVSEDYTMKIADFGLAKNMQTRDYYKKTSSGKLPVKWIAPEALLHYTYTAYSDVWSFGILLWEIMTFGGTPYPTMSSEELFDALQNGYRMGRPSCCPQPIYLTMSCCWNQEPELRPTFDDLVISIEQILGSMMSNQEENVYDGLPPLDTPPSSSE